MSELRADLAIISQWIEPGSRVLDLGCGDGVLLKYLQTHRQVSGYGLEIDPANVVACIRNKVDVIQTDLDAGLSDFDPDSFDYVVMSQTLQAVLYPHKLIQEMLRIGRQGIVTFPNFGYWRLRLHLALRGRMPESGALPHTWYETPNIHLCTLKDFEALCRTHNIRILQRHVLDHTHRHQRLSRLLPNVLGEVAMYRFERGNGQ
jgi:methionine biosynthesis protein MetW